MGAAQSVTEMLHAGATPADIAAQLLDGLGTTPGFTLVPRCITAMLCVKMRPYMRWCRYQARICYGHARAMHLSP